MLARLAAAAVACALSPVPSHDAAHPGMGVALRRKRRAEISRVARRRSARNGRRTTAPPRQASAEQEHLPRVLCSLPDRPQRCCKISVPAPPQRQQLLVASPHEQRDRCDTQKEHRAHHDGIDHSREQHAKPEPEIIQRPQQAGFGKREQHQSGCEHNAHHVGSARRRLHRAAFCL